MIEFDESAKALTHPTPDQYGYTHGGLTKREYAALMLRVPDSGLTWMDEMINVARRDDMASVAMQGWLSNSPKISGVQLDGRDEHTDAMTGLAYSYADAMLSAGGKP